MNYSEIVCEYINKCNLDEPLFIEEIKQYAHKIVQIDITNSNPKQSQYPVITIKIHLENVFRSL